MTAVNMEMERRTSRGRRGIWWKKGRRTNSWRLLHHWCCGTAVNKEEREEETGLTVGKEGRGVRWGDDDKIVKHRAQKVGERTKMTQPRESVEHSNVVVTVSESKVRETEREWHICQSVAALCSDCSEHSASQAITAGEKSGERTDVKSQIYLSVIFNTPTTTTTTARLTSKKDNLLD